MMAGSSLTPRMVGMGGLGGEMGTSRSDIDYNGQDNGKPSWADGSELNELAGQAKQGLDKEVKDLESPQILE